MQSSGEHVRLRPSSGFGRALVRVFLLAVCFGTIVAVAGLITLVQAAESTMNVLSWLLTVLGLLLVATGLLLLALSRWLGRPATLTPAGIVRPGRKGVIPWQEVERCETRRGEDGRPLLAAWLKGRETPLWLGITSSDGAAEQKIESWMRHEGS